MLSLILRDLNIPFIIFIALAVIDLVAIVIIQVTTTKFSQVSSQNRLLRGLRSLDKIAFANVDLGALCQGIVDVIHQELGFTFAVLALVDYEARLIRRVAISLDAQSARELHEMLPVKFHQQVVSFDNIENLFARVVLEKRPLDTNNLYDIQLGVLPEEVSQKIQKNWNLKSIFLYPIIIRGEVRGILEYSSTKEKDKVLPIELTIMEEFTAEASRAMDNTLLYQNLSEASRELADSNERLKELDKLKDDFVSITSHELRTPMTAIRSYVWMALHKSDIPLSQKLARYLYRTLTSTERLINLVNDLLNISRIEAGRIEITPQELDMVTLVQDVLEEIKPKIEERGLKVLLNSTRAPKVLADPSKTRQILLNLLGNALKFTPTSGQIGINFFSDGQMLEIEVKDSGPGISRDDLGRLFQKFGRLDNSYVAMGTSGGSGLGLYISKRLVELMRGRIWAVSEGLGKGASFIFSLPVASGEALLQKEKYTIRPVGGEIKELEPVAI